MSYHRSPEPDPLDQRRSVAGATTPVAPAKSSLFGLVPESWILMAGRSGSGEVPNRVSFAGATTPVAPAKIHPLVGGSGSGTQW